MKKSTCRRMPHYTRGIVQMSQKYIKGNTLDLGAGSAKYKNIIMQSAEKYTAFDMVEGPNIDVVGDVHELPFTDNEFDTIICTQVMEHVLNPWIMVEEIARVLKPNGKCILSTPFMMPFHADPWDYYRYTLEGGCHLFERSGMTIIDKAKYGGLNVVMAETFKFSFCNPYVHVNPGFIRRNIFRVVHKLLLSLSNSTNQKTAIYANIYIVAQK